MKYSLFPALAALAAFATSAPAAEPPPDLALVPGNALAFAHVRIGDTLKNEHLKDVRDFLAKAGPDAMQKFSERFMPNPFDVDRVTAFAIMPEGAREPMVSVIFRMLKPFDSAKLVKAIAPNGVASRTAAGKSLVIDGDNDIGVLVIDDRTFQLGGAREFEKVLAWPRREGALTKAISGVGSKAVFVAINAAAIPREVMAQVPAAAVPIAKLNLATFSIELGNGAKVEARMSYPDGDSAKDAEQMLHSLVELGKGALVGGRAELEKMLEGGGRPGTLEELPLATAAVFGLGAIRQYEEILATLPLKRDGNDLALAVDIPPGAHASAVGVSAVAVGLLLPAVQKVREAAARTSSANNLKQHALAMHNYNDAYAGKLPAHAIYSKDGKTPLLSWRVAILPFIEHDNLYRSFKLDEPWDSEHNKKLIPQMPKVYMVPGRPQERDPGKTHYQIFVGGEAPWDKSPNAPGIPRTFTDGTSNTILIAEAATPVIWTKPEDLDYDPQKPLPKMASFWGPGTFLVALADGSVRTLNIPKTAEANLRAAITANGGEVLGLDW